MKLSKRELTLITILILILVTVVPFLTFIRPKLSILVRNRDTLHVMEDQKFEMEKRIQKMEENLLQMEQLQKDASELYELMEQTKSYDISLILSELLISHNLTPVSLNISPYQQAVVPVVTKGEADEKAKEKAQALANQDMAFIRTADLFFTGKKAEVNDFIDELTNFNKSVLIQSFTISQNDTDFFEIKINFYEFAEPKIEEAAKE